MLRPYQITASDQCFALLAEHEKIVLCMPTGAGKTFTFVEIARRFLAENPGKRVLVLVHRVKLLAQAAESFRAAGITCETITAEKKHVNGSASVFVGMVETVNNRFKRNPAYLNRIGLVISDECHITAFNKIYTHFPGAKVIGCTATPVSGDIQQPLNLTYEKITVPVSIPELVADRFLCPAVHIQAAIPDRDGLTLNSAGTDYTEGSVSSVMGQAKYIRNVNEAITEYGFGKKTMVFCADIAHCVKVTEYLTEQGHNVRMVHSDLPQEDVAAALEWFSKTANGVLVNVAILTTGYDEPSVHNIVVARITKSLPLWLQMCGRGSRQHPDSLKDHFKIIDLGGNIQELGYWDQDINWAKIFYSARPKKKDKKKLKRCPACYEEMAPHLRECFNCGYIFKKKEEEFYTEDELVLAFEIAKFSGIPEPDPVVVLNTVRAFGQKEHRAVYLLIEKTLEHFVLAAGKKISYPDRRVEFLRSLWPRFWAKYLILQTISPKTFPDNESTIRFWKTRFMEKADSVFGYAAKTA